MKPASSRAIAITHLLAPLLAAQAPEPSSEVLPATPIGSVRVPIHTQEDDPLGGEYGIWAAGADYKVSFHDRFTFVPYLGSDYPHNQPFTWTTTSVTVGGVDIVDVDAEPARSHSEYRYEYHFGGFVEAYDVLLEGAEQTFTLDRHPGVAGDLVIEGAITSAMDTMRIGDQHGPMTFRDANGDAILQYGETYAVDAHDVKLPITSSWDGTHIRLRVPRALLDDAAYPLVIDPLLSPVCITYWIGTGGSVNSTDIGRDDIWNQPAIVYSRDASASDGDLYAHLFDDDSPSGFEANTIFTDLTSGWDTSQGAIAAHNGASAHWVIAFTRIFSLLSGGVRYHLHPVGDTSLGTGVGAVNVSGQIITQNVDVGAARLGASQTNAMLVFEGIDSSFDWDVYISVINTTSMTHTTPFAISTTSSNVDSMAPAINQVSGPQDGWVVAWQEYTGTLGDDWDVIVRRTNHAGGVYSGQWTASNSPIPDTHLQEPKVEGMEGRYLVTMTSYKPGGALLSKELDRRGEAIRAERLDWPLGGSPTSGGLTTLIAQAGSQRFHNTGLAHDWASGTLWFATYHSTASGAGFVTTVGTSGSIVEHKIAYPNFPSNTTAISATYNDDLDETLLCYSTDEAGSCASNSNHPVYVQINTSAGCSTAASVTVTHRPTHIQNSVSSSGVPFIGNPDWRITADDPSGCVPAPANVFFMFGATSSIPGAILGGFGCGFGPGEVNCIGPVAVGMPYNGQPVTLSIPIPSSIQFCGAPICVQPMFLGSNGIDVCGVLDAVVGV